MKQILIGVLLAFAFLAGVFGGARAYEWKHYTDKRAFYAEAAGSYLFGASGVINARGEALSRQQILDAYLHAQIEAHPEWGLKFAK